MIKKTAVYKDKIIVVESNDVVSVIRFFETKGKTKHETDVIGIFHVDPNVTIKPYAIYRNTWEALRIISDELGFNYSQNWITQEFGSKLVDYINSTSQNL